MRDVVKETLPKQRGTNWKQLLKLLGGSCDMSCQIYQHYVHFQREQHLADEVLNIKTIEIRGIIGIYMIFLCI